MNFQGNDFLEKEEIDNSSKARSIPLRAFKEKPEERERRILRLIKTYEDRKNDIVFNQLTIYVEKSGGKWDAFWYSRDENKKLIFCSHDKDEAIKKAVKASGYSPKQVKVVII